MDASWPVTVTKRSGSGMSNRADFERHCMVIPLKSIASPSRLIVSAYSVAVQMACYGCGMWKTVSAYVLSRVTGLPSTTSTGILMAPIWSVVEMTLW